MLNGNLIIAYFITQYILFFLSILNTEKMLDVTHCNQEIERLRNKPNKTLDEQKEFIRLKYQQYPTSAFSWKRFFIDSLKFSSVFLPIWLGLEKLTNFEPNFFITLIVCTLIGFIINRILIKYDLQRQDGIDVLFR